MNGPDAFDFAIVGGGIMGLTIARELKRRFPAHSVCVVEKETDVAMHASGRNSGVLHAGFYYTADSLKARFTRDGNREMAEYCHQHGLKINHCGKLVVATNEDELRGLEELKRRGDRNGVELMWVDETQLDRFNPHAVTYKRALFSPNTACVDPAEVCRALLADNQRQGVTFFFGTRYRRRRGDTIVCDNRELRARYLINAAGLYADVIAREHGFGQEYTIIPFKGIYLKYDKSAPEMRTLIYPVPRLSQPFLGVHFTRTVDGTIKIGPTATPAFWREHYEGWQRFRPAEFFAIARQLARLWRTDTFHFRQLAREEMRKYNRRLFVQSALHLVRGIDADGFGRFLRPGIRAQLLNKHTLELVQDFVVLGDGRSMHVLNAVSPAFTCSMPFARYVVERVTACLAGTPGAPASPDAPKGPEAAAARRG
ncbi:MAG: L-2-hydroxyglutarate oxidase [Alicyclobacillaceae bacterium]|nr:L-2-hydroxyglutarate oxidase [Alicyclobacillaceae bacterium]